jgi:hypothetical protein
VIYAAAVIYGVIPLQPIPDIIFVENHPYSLLAKGLA